MLAGALAWNGHRYGAYFVVHGVSGPAQGHYGDKLVYVNDSGALQPGGWPWGCSHNEGIALAPMASGPFASLCFEDWRSGLFISTGIGAPDDAPVISREACWAGYCGGQFGGLVRLPDGRFFVAFTTRGMRSMKPDGTGRGYIVTPRYKSHQLAFAVPDSGASAVARKKVIFSLDTGVDHVNMHVARYGSKYLLVSYETVQARTCNDLATGTKGTCLGRFTGTHLQLMTLTGQKAGPAVVVPEKIVGQIGVLADGGPVWAYAPVTPDYSKPIYSPTGSTKTLDIAVLAPPA